MKCPVCERELAPTLSICPSCGAMMFDSVREELQTKITSGRLPRTANVEIESTPMAMPQQPPIFVPSPEITGRRPQPAMAMGGGGRTAAAVAIAPEPVRPVHTADLTPARTNPTLMGFQSKNPSVPDWRLQLQNAVQQRKGSRGEDPLAVVSEPRLAVARAAAPMPEAINPNTKAAEPQIADERVANALRRISESRDAFLEAKKVPMAVQPAPAKPYKFDVFVGNAITPPVRTYVPAPQKPRLVAPPIQLKRDTNKLLPIEEVIGASKTPTRIHGTSIVSTADNDAVEPTEFGAIKRIRISAEPLEANSLLDELESNDIEDLATISMRFGAGLFDLIITSFASLLILSPIAFSRGEWLTGVGLLAFTGVFSIITFFYMTICVGFFGKTMGMRLFSLELVDALENEYPSLHQAAVSSSVFLLTLFFGGAGFVTMFFNEEKRAAHDLLSGTILVREF